MEGLKTGYLQLKVGGKTETLKCYTNTTAEATQRVYVEARGLPFLNSSQPHHKCFARWVSKGVPRDHWLPSTKAGPQQGTHEAWPQDGLPEMSVSLAAALFMLTLSTSHHRGSSSDNEQASSFLKAILSATLGCLSDMETKNFNAEVFLFSKEVVQLDLEKDNLYVGGLQQADFSISPLCKTNLPENGILPVKDLLLALKRPNQSDELWRTCLSISRQCEDVMCLVSYCY